MKILVDALGGDNAPQAVLEGASKALASRKDLNLVIVGPTEDCKNTLTKLGADLTRVEFLNAKEAVLNTDHPAMFLKQKPESTLAVAYDALRRRDDIDGMLTAGPTGAVLTGAVLRLGRIPGIERPGLISTLPTKNDSYVRVIDSGANMDCKPQYLYQFAVMASTYLKCIGIDNPRVSLLNVGAEEGKGDDLSKEAFGLLKNSSLNFVGNIEAREVLSGSVDVLVCDGFSGNILLKCIEGTAMTLMKKLKAIFYKNTVNKLAAAVLKKDVYALKAMLDPSEVGGTALLGISKPVIKAHGSSDARAIRSAVRQAITFIDSDVIASIEKNVAYMRITPNEGE